MEDSTAKNTQNKLEDLSGIVLQPGENPYAAFINACSNDNVTLTPPFSKPVGSCISHLIEPESHC